jgi:hypothetical protein
MASGFQDAASCRSIAVRSSASHHARDVICGPSVDHASELLNDPVLGQVFKQHINLARTMPLAEADVQLLESASPTLRCIDAGCINGIAAASMAQYSSSKSEQGCRTLVSVTTTALL